MHYVNVPSKGNVEKAFQKMKHCYRFPIRMTNFSTGLFLSATSYVPCVIRSRYSNKPHNQTYPVLRSVFVTCITFLHKDLTVPKLHRIL